ncbi:FtsX-like permease family protein [Paenibacillus sp. HGF5]|uniref:FtsX-like permease family protein n=1 Tax=Paenibacillus sp. HGF5 TaxID=908341 RepID=UPI00020726B5|nr:FtsX-like permease family protein [Paenibacillus sp. HGF5]EGG31427.1 efflux ABC transporter, permease protein [Paenibacillus sp. HGF5]
MIHSLRGIAFRILARNKSLLFFSLISVGLAVFLMITMSSFLANANRSIDHEVKQQYGDVDMMVGYTNEVDHETSDQRIMDLMQSTGRVRQASPVMLSQMFVNDLAAPVAVAGIEDDALSKSRYHIQVHPERGELILNQSLAEELQLRAGGRMKVEGKAYIVKEIIGDPVAAGAASDLLLMDLEEVRQIQTAGARHAAVSSYLMVQAEDDTDLMVLGEQLQELDPGITLEIAAENSTLKASLSVLGNYILVISVLIVMVISLLIISNFEGMLHKYRFQFAVLRSMGAQTEQLFKMVFIQCTVTNGLGILSGLLVSLLSYTYIIPWISGLFAFPLTNFRFDGGAAALVAVTSFIILEIFMLVPAYRSTKILPLKMLEMNQNNDFKGRKRGKTLGKVLMAASLFSILFGVAFSGTPSANAEFGFLMGFLLFVWSVFTMVPVYLPGVLAKMSPVLKLIAGRVSYVAIKNLVPQVKKNTFVILTISLAMMIAVIGSSLLNTIQHNERNYIKTQYATDIQVVDRLENSSSIDPEQLKQRISELEGIQEVSTVSRLSPAKQGQDGRAIDYALADLDALAAQRLLPKISDVGNAVIVSNRYADEHALSIGDSITLSVYQEEDPENFKNAGTLTVAAITEPFQQADMYIDWSNSAFHTKFTVFGTAYVTPANENAALKQLQGIKGQFPTVDVSSYAQALENSSNMYTRVWSFFLSAIIVIMLSVTIGVFNSLINNIYSKRKEYAVLRAISVDKKGLVGIILTQVLLYLCIGMIVGITLGIILLYAFRLIDPAPIHIHASFVTAIMGMMLALAFAVFLPYASSLANKKIVPELNENRA